MEDNQVELSTLLLNRKRALCFFEYHISFVEEIMFVLIRRFTHQTSRPTIYLSMT